jgi:hypothetical protein
MKMPGVPRNPSLSSTLSGLIAPGGPCFLDLRSPFVIVGRDGLGLTDVAVQFDAELPKCGTFFSENLEMLRLAANLSDNFIPSRCRFDS